MAKLPEGAGEYRLPSQTEVLHAPVIDRHATMRMALWYTLRLNHYDKDWNYIDD